MLLAYHEAVSSVVRFDLELEKLDPCRGRAPVGKWRGEGSFPGRGANLRYQYLRLFMHEKSIFQSKSVMQGGAQDDQGAERRGG